ncbi:MAG: bifunctional 2-polyprenyl-6-hydroxyphenol methylase/3-demethylubiquinol 3-O-methyltransferase UbiG [Parvularculales bacterium]
MEKPPLSRLTMTTSPPNPSTIDKTEIARFAAMADTWWNPKGKFRPLHIFNPVRLNFIRKQVCAHFGCDETSLRPFEGLSFLDIGCGGGLVSEPMTRLGGRVTGVDAGESTVMTAKHHATSQGLEIDYQATTAEELASSGVSFDVVLNMEVVEHVADVPLFIDSCADLTAPGGLMIVATLNRTLKSFALAIVGAEYILRWLPRGTHQWAKFIKPSELCTMLEKTGMDITHIGGVVYNPLTDQWSESNDTDVNYMMVATRHVAS